jgi:hypothetical protein
MHKNWAFPEKSMVRFQEVAYFQVGPVLIEIDLLNYSFYKLYWELRVKCIRNHIIRIFRREERKRIHINRMLQWGHWKKRFMCSKDSRQVPNTIIITIHHWLICMSDRMQWACFWSCIKMSRLICRRRQRRKAGGVKSE